MQLAYYEAGTSPSEMQQAATYTSAKFKEGQLGIIQAEAYADLVAERGDPEQGFPTSLLNVVFVMKEGKAILSEPEDTSAMAEHNEHTGIFQINLFPRHMIHKIHSG